MNNKNEKAGKTRLAVLGGGPSALTALYNITSDPDTCAQYDITVYQMGFRLGGKGASGRAEYGRIEEHGLHVLFGFYNNFFAMMRKCYEEIDRPSTAPLSDMDKAFKPHNFGVVEEFFQGHWQPWPLEFPVNDSEPGSEEPWDTNEDYVSMFGQALLELIFGWRALNKRTGHQTIFNRHGHHEHKPSNTDWLVNLIMRVLEWPLKRAISHKDSEKRYRCTSRIISWFQKTLWPIARKLSGKSLASHRFWLGCDFILAAIKGVIDDEVYTQGGFNRIDEYDFRAWLKQHGIHDITLPSPYCRTVYDAAFSYKDGDPLKQEVAAGAALRALFRMGFTYKGSAYYKMQAGMGDTVFGPIYEVLKKRGVKFKFFHKVESLHLSPAAGEDGKKSIASIQLTQQAFLKSGNDTDYQPLIDVENLPCWPSAPLYEQLEHADILQQHDLESYYDKIPQMHTRGLTLKAGEDYDKVLYAIPIGAVPYICEELVDDSQRWRDMVKHVQSVTTVSFQLWFNEDLQELGWTMPSPLLSLYVEPLNTWADMSQVIERESWPTSLEPKNISYYTGVQKGPEHAPDPRDPANANFEVDQYAVAKELGIQFCESSLTNLMPNAMDKTCPPDVNWNVIVDPENRSGKDRFDSQYWRSNCGPSERCTIALPGATRYRMKANDTGYSNLCITGDWIDNGLYVACMEGAITSGIYGARAVTGINYPIIGEKLNEM
jgi:uncharacterized protein with NAD-binding domain and iron-sulfur cluster